MQSKILGKNQSVTCDTVKNERHDPTIPRDSTFKYQESPEHVNRGTRNHANFRRSLYNDLADDDLRIFRWHHMYDTEDYTSGTWSTIAWQGIV